MDPLLADVVHLCATALRLETVGPDDDLWELGLDSLAAVDLALGCSDLGWGELEPTELIEAATPAALAEVLRTLARASFAPRVSDVVVLTETGSRPPIVAFPGAGSTALAFRWLARTLGDDQPFRVVEAHGLHTVGDPDRTIDAQADRGAAALTGAVPEGPVVLVGHSAGGAVAFEVGRRLAAAGGSPVVVLLDAVLLWLQPRPPALRRWRSGLAGWWDRLPRRALIRDPGPPSQDPRRFAAFTDIGVRALVGYRPGPAAFPVWHLLVAGSGAATGWGDLPGGLVAGEHLTMLSPPHVGGLAARIAEIVDLADPRAAGH